jgi:alpha-beta hydrolase superfamily lysophospholipase
MHALDHRGHGDSEGDRVWVGAFDEYLKDFELVTQKARAAHPGKPLFVFGHSMGGNIVTRHALEATPSQRASSPPRARCT